MSNFVNNATKSTPHRSSTVIGSSGPAGASFALVENNWKCDSCQVENLARRLTCSRCRSRKPKHGGGTEWHEGAIAYASGDDHGWREAIDPETKQLYYYKQSTGETRWDRPNEMGEALSATGWYGRGKVNSNNQVELDMKNVEYLKRPAIKQIDETEAGYVSYLQGTENFNIYYGKFNGEQWSHNRVTEPAKSRCSVALHAGYTLADKLSKSASRYFCMMWCKGSCYKGKKCKFFHRIPTYADIGKLEKDMLHDCFGRERHARHREDMQGNGSFNDPCRTLYVGKLQRNFYSEKPKELENVLYRHFSEFGEVEHINVIWAKAIAFVRFRFRTHAEVAKEALACQTLDHDEILDVRWAYEDPNPVAKESIRRANADAVLAAIKASGHDTLNMPYEIPVGYNLRDSAKEASFSVSSTVKQESKAASEIEPEFYYPNTDSQYPTSVQPILDPPAKRKKTAPIET